MIQWSIMGEVDGAFAATSVILVLGLAAVATSPPEPYIAYVCAAGVIGLVVFFPIVRSTLNKRAMAKIDLEHLERLHEQIRFRPDNIGTKFRIAEMLYHRGYAAHAMGLAESLTPKMPPQLYANEYRLLEDWRRQWRGNPPMRVIACPKCGTYNPPGDLLCTRCGDEYLLKSAKGVWVTGGWAIKLVVAWLVAIVGIVGIPAVAKSKLPREAVLAVIIALLVGAAYLFVRAFLLREGDSEEA